MARNINRKPIAYQGGIVTVENLPLRYVLYPDYYGTFFGFQETEDSPIYLCSCCYVAIENYLKFRLSYSIQQYSDKSRMFILDSLHFPFQLVESLMGQGVENNDRVLSYLRFKDRICHECNRETPSYSYCHKMYGGAFKQTYGWYINKQGYEYGVDPTTNTVLLEVCPQEIQDLLELDPNTYADYRQRLAEKDFYKAYEFDKKFSKQIRCVWRVIENEVRQKFGHKKVGEAWTSETILYYIVRSLLPQNTVLRHHRPDFLEGLELDIYIPELKIALEYQGIQHYRPVKHWGGEDALKRYKERDFKKREICKNLGIRLLYFDYRENLSDEVVYNKLVPYL